MTEKCGCKVEMVAIDKDHTIFTFRFDYCPLHKAAGDLLEALKVVKLFFDKLNDGLPIDDPISVIRKKFHKPILDTINPIIAKAEGK